MALQEIKELHESGVWVKMPCKIGDTAYFITARGRYGTIKTAGIIVKRTVSKIIYDGKRFELYSDREHFFDEHYYGYLGDEAFITEEEAEKRLEEIRK